ncbi:SWI SNF-related matrix-associated actin-dependent regulator of chromatin subfamily A containing, partial [Paramuricea clavata]
MKRKITTNLSVFKYKRPCPILKEDMNRITTDREASSDEELLISPFKKCKLREANCTKSSGKNSADEKYSSKTILDSSSDDDTENCRSEKAESIKTFDESSDSSSFTSLTFNESTSLEQDDTNYRLGVLKGIFKNSYTEGKLLNAINDTNGLDHAVSVLIESTSDNEEDDDSVEQDLEKLMKKFPACDKEELRTVLEENSFCLEDAMGSLELFSSPVKKKSKSKEKRKKCIDFDEVVDCVTIDDNSDIGNNSDDNKNTSDVNKSTSDVNKNTSAELGAPLEMSGLTQAITIVHDDCDDEDDDCDDCDDEDDDYGLSDGEQDLAMSSADKASVVSFVDSADVTELALVKGCSVIKAKMICSLRPFSTWRDLLKKVHYTKGLTDEFLWECQTFVNERDKMGYLMEKCERISKAMKDCIEVKSSSTENASMLVTKKQYVTKEPSLVPSGAKLKSYQLTGLNWLIALHKRGLNGILADEMGLGKTIQSIVFLAYLLEQEENGPHLIVVPSSTFDNWKRELEGWCPSIKCLHYYGSAAERSLLRDEALDSRHEFHVLLTT